MNHELIASVFEWVVSFATQWLLPVMTISWAGAIVLRGLMYFCVGRERWFAAEFEKRVNDFLDRDDLVEDMSFFVATKRLLEKTFYESFVVRGILKRRKPDAVRSLTDRLFLIEHGTARLVKDTIRRTRHLKFGGESPKFIDVSKSVYGMNPCFNRVFGIIPVGAANEVVSILPGLFIVGGIFGTFLGIMGALPELGNMDLADPDKTKLIMDTFLVKIAFSMAKSVQGILFSVTLTLINAALSPERAFVTAVDRYEGALQALWNRSRNNTLPHHGTEFDEHKDPIDALAEDALNKELAKKKLFIHEGIPGAPEAKAAS